MPLNPLPAPYANRLVYPHTVAATARAASLQRPTHRGGIPFGYCSLKVRTQGLQRFGVRSRRMR